eukprot:831917-Pyramimonas_sp.AAC.1
MLDTLGTDNFDNLNGRRPQMLEFVASKGEQIGMSFNRLVMDDQFDSVWGPLLDITGNRDTKTWLMHAVRFSLEMYADYYRRVLQPLQDWPFLLLKLVISPADVICSTRRRRLT